MSTVEVTCPYCGAEFGTALEMKAEKQIQLVRCQAFEDDACGQPFVLEYHLEPVITEAKIEGYETKDRSE